MNKFFRSSQYFQKKKKKKTGTSFLSSRSFQIDLTTIDIEVRRSSCDRFREGQTIPEYRDSFQCVEEKSTFHSLSFVAEEFDETYVSSSDLGVLAIKIRFCENSWQETTGKTFRSSEVKYLREMCASSGECDNVSSRVRTSYFHVYAYS